MIIIYHLKNYHGYLSAIDRILEYQKIDYRDAVCTIFYSWLRDRLLALFDQRVNETTQQRQSIPNMKKLDDENSSADTDNDHDESDPESDKKLEIEMFFSNVIYLLLEIEYVLLKDDTNGLRYNKLQSLKNEDIIQIMQHLMNNQRSWYKVYIQCNDDKILQSMFSQQWKTKIAEKIMTWFGEHDQKLADHDYHKSFINEIEKYGIDSSSLRETKQQHSFARRFRFLHRIER